MTGRVVCSTNAKDPASYDFLLGMAGMTYEKKGDIATDDLSVLYLVLGKVPQKLSLRPDNGGEEAYAMESTADSIVIAANTEKGLALGVKLLVRLHRAGMLSQSASASDEMRNVGRARSVCDLR